ncbi:MAG: hypothetical protein ABR956_13735 [Terracidiphilus sp.]
MNLRILTGGADSRQGSPSGDSRFDPRHTRYNTRWTSIGLAA